MVLAFKVLSSLHGIDEIVEDTNRELRVGLNKTETSSRMTASEITQDKTSAATPTGKFKMSGEYRLYNFRWLIQIMFTTCMISSGMMMVGFAPVATTISKIYSCKEIFIQIQTLIFLVAFIPGNFLVINILNKRGLRTTVSRKNTVLLRISCILTNTFSC